MDLKGADDGPLKGKRIAIKDNIFIAGTPLSNGSKIWEGYTPEVDATIVTRILDAGKLSNSTSIFLVGSLSFSLSLPLFPFPSSPSSAPFLFPSPSPLLPLHPHLPHLFSTPLPPHLHSPSLFPSPLPSSPSTSPSPVTKILDAGQCIHHLPNTAVIPKPQ